MTGESRLGERVAALERDAIHNAERLKSVETTVERQGEEIGTLRRFQSWVFGVAAGLGVLITLAVQAGLAFLTQVIKSRISG